MMKSISVLGGSAILSMLIACTGAGGPTTTGSAASSLTVRGYISPAARTLDNARVMAISTTGKTYWAYLDAKGAFSIDVPVGHAYRVLLANATRTGNLRTIGHLQLQTTHGASVWFGARAAGAVDLGALKIAGVAASTLTAKDEKPDLGGGSSGEPQASSSSGDDHGDYESHESDDEHESVCRGEKDDNEKDDDVDVEAEDGKEPGEACDDKGLDDDDSDHDGVDDKDEEDKKLERPCSASGGGSSSGGSSSGAPPSGGSSGSSGSSTGGTPPPPPPPPPAAPTTAPGSVPLGGACTVNADCAGIAVACVASTCTIILK